MSRSETVDALRRHLAEARYESDLIRRLVHELRGISAHDAALFLALAAKQHGCVAELARAILDLDDPPIRRPHAPAPTDDDDDAELVCVAPGPVCLVCGHRPCEFCRTWCDHLTDDGQCCDGACTYDSGAVELWGAQLERFGDLERVCQGFGPFDGRALWSADT